MASAATILSSIPKPALGSRMSSMNAADVIPLSASPTVARTNKVKPAPPVPVHVRFDAFELDEPNALLLHDGKAVTLPPKPFGLLCALARRPVA